MNVHILKTMNLSKIKNDLQQVLKLVEDWQDKGIDTLERDLTLEKLRQIYSDVRFGALSQSENEVSEEDSQSTDLFPESIEESTIPSESIPVGIAISLDDVFEEFMPESIIPEEGKTFDEEVLAESETETEVEIETAETKIDSESDIEEDEGDEECVVEPAETESEIEPATEEHPENAAEDSITEDEVEEKFDDTTEAVTEDVDESVAEEVTPTPKTSVESQNDKEVSTPTQSTSMGQPSLFGDDLLFAPRPSRRTRIMSLYDDDTHDKSVAAPTSTVSTPTADTDVQQPNVQPEVEAKYIESTSADSFEADEEFVEVDVESAVVEDMQDVESEVEKEFEQIAEPTEQGSTTSVIEERTEPEVVTEPYIEPQIEVAIATPAINAVPESEQVLGEVIKSNVKTIADTIKPKDTAAEQIVKGAVSDIGKAVGINDRFLLIRDLFGGSSEEYERVMAQLNCFDNLDDCMIYIAENFDWNPNSDGAKLIMELLERKYC